MNKDLNMNLKDILSEIGSKNGDHFDLSWPRERESGRSVQIEYTFDTLEHNYFIGFDGKKLMGRKEGQMTFVVEFGTLSEALDELTGENKPFKVVRTVAKAIEDVIEKYGDKINYFKLEGIEKPGEERESYKEPTQRAKFYKRFFENYFENNTVSLQGKNVYIYV